MRTIFCVLIGIILVLCAQATDTNWTKKQVVPALIVDKWEDWSAQSDGVVRNPYKVMFSVNIDGRDYTERGYLDAREWQKAVVGETIRPYATKLKDLKVPPTKHQDSMDSLNSFILFLLFIGWPILITFCVISWMEN